ncbi:glycoprotein [Mount Elgon bat virus]|uniref:Glycoprotein n=1 Tax=Mount Elgon bat virus TaxID=380434 RepID=A0A0D3R1Y2_9RHAB|nr:glycoprotein [Mount Elgon bat virus]AJR28606.1 glycoprotein [Mount Elgon bat virus]
MKFLIVSILYILKISTNASKERKLILPLDHHLDWKPAHFDKLTCPKPELDWSEEYKPINVISVLRPPNHKIGGVSGYLCHKVEWITRCDYKWYLSKTVSRRIKEETPTEAECRDAVILHKNGRETSGSFPPEECYWNSVNDESDIKVSVTAHDIGYDPYLNVGVDSLLVGGYCNNSICLTTHSSVIWIRDQVSKPCEGMRLETMTVYTSLYGYTNDKWVGTPSMKMSSLNDACRLSFCGVQGTLLTNGLWFHHNVREGPGSQIQITRNCPPNSEVGVVQPDFEIKLMDYKLADLQREMFCLQTLDRIRLQQVVTLNDLQYLRPHRAGAGPVFRIRNNTLETTHGTYIEASMVGTTQVNRNCLATYLGEDKKPKCIGWKSWHKMNNHKYQGLNGVLEINGLIKFPEDQLLDAEWEADMFEYFKLDKIHHPFLSNISSIIHDDTDESLIHDKTVNPGDAINNWVEVAENRVSTFFKTTGGEIIKIVYIITLIGIIYLLYKIITMCCKMKRTGKKNRRLTSDLIDLDLKPMNSSVFG